MSIDVAARIKLPTIGEGQPSLKKDHDYNRIKAGDALFNFQYLFSEKSSNIEVYRKSVEPLLDMFFSGYNVCLLVTGESDSGKSYTLAGDHDENGQSGIAHILLERLFSKIEGSKSEFSQTNAKVQLQLYEIYNEKLHDLLLREEANRMELAVDQSAEEGQFVKNGTKRDLTSIEDAFVVFDRAWSMRSDEYSEFGPTKNHSHVICFMDLVRYTVDNDVPNMSRFTLLKTSGTESLSNDGGVLVPSGAPDIPIHKSIFAFYNLTTHLAKRELGYNLLVKDGSSILTALLNDEFGGNCKTRVLMCFHPFAEETVIASHLKWSNQLSRIKNFPILNDYFAQRLISKYRGQIMAYKGLSYGEPVGPDELADFQEELRRLQTQNIQLRDKNEALLQRNEMLNGQYGTLALSKTDISTQLLMTEEEKLKVSKTLVEMQIENNRLREESEAAKFELTNKVLQLENKVTELELDRDRHVKIAKQSREKMNEVERNRKELADEYVNIKSKYLGLKKRIEDETVKNEELCIEVLNLANAKAALMRELEDVLHSGYKHGDPSSEIDRIRAMVNRLSVRKADDLVAALKDNLEKELFGSSKYYETELQRLRFQHDDDAKKLERKMAIQTKELHEARNLARERQKKLSEINVQIITMRSERDQLRSQNNRMQHKLKDINDEFRSRLVKYVQDIAEYVDKKFSFKDEKAKDRMTNYVREMLRDMNKSHKVREDQLSQAAQSYKQRMNHVVQRYEMLLLAYGEIRGQVEARGLEDIDFGPEERLLALDETELNSEQQRKIKKLQTEIHHLQNEIESLKIRTRFENSTSPEKTRRGRSSPADGGSNWSDLRKQLREFTLNTQQELELERAELLTRNAMLEQEVQELNDYIDSHLTRYKEEIERLRGQLGIDANGFASPSDRNRPRRR